ncbi:hypothetical protein AB0J40_17320 [Amycolatopsis sp. NPDC049691]|uniref:hypothetical protein n=1 Tax=Amycolatopsis sp. NPDC049691 TaxID=3155155 RepID=UPI00341CD576
MPEYTEFSRALLLAVDMWRYGARDGWQQAELQQVLSEMVSAAAAVAGLDQAAWEVQDGGDGFFARVADSAAEPALVGPFVRELDARLGRFNYVRRLETRLRLRISMHHGGSVPAAHGHASDGPVHVNRLLNAEQARAVLAELPEANLVQIVSQPIFEGCVRQRLTEVSEAEFSRIRVDLPAKEFSADAWIRVPGVPAATVSGLTGGPGTLVVSLHPLTPVRNSSDFVGQVLARACVAAAVTLPGDFDEGVPPFTLSLAESDGDRVLGVWLHHLKQALQAHDADLRIVVGVAFGPSPVAARELASGNVAGGYLSGIDGSPLVVVVSDDVHWRIIAGSTARMVMPDSYRPLGTEPESWLRVPGYSVPPDPAPPRRDAPTAPRFGVVHGPASNFEGGTFNAPIVVGSWHNYGEPGR